MQILLIDPPFHRFMDFHRCYYPVGLAYMAAVLKRKGHTVHVYDAEHSRAAKTQSWAQATQKCDDYIHALADDADPAWEDIRSIIEERRPDVVGVSMLSVKAASALKAARICKEVDERIPVIVGGDHATALPPAALGNPCIDVVVRGEGEVTVAELIDRLGHEDWRTRLSDVAGISYRCGDRIYHTPDRPKIQDLDALPYPEVDALLEPDSYRPVDYGIIISSRGCPWRCTFCGVHVVWTRRVRFRSIDNVLEEIAYIKRRYGTQYFSVRDATFSLDRDRTLDFCNGLLDLGLDISWECVTRADRLDEETIAALRRAGCITVRIGVESGDDELLGHMQKDLSLDEVRRTAKLLNAYGFYWSAYFLFGTPRETRRSMQKTLDFIEEIDPPFVTAARYTPLPGTRMYRELESIDRVSPYINWAMETNQRIDTDYLLDMDKSTFEDEMRRVREVIDARNERKSEAMAIRDQRLM